jgi:bacillithiol biosynthesis deacetylase BshB1
MMDVVAFGAHPDDVEICCGGLIALLVQQGKRVALCDLTRGELGTRGTPGLRAQEADRAATILGAAQRVQLDLGDGHLDTSHERRAAVVEVLREMQPKLVIAPMLSDLHPDHAVAGALVKSAFYLARIRKWGSSGHHRANHLVHFFQHELDQASFVVDISSTMKVKHEAIRCYQSQLFDPSSTEPGTQISSQSFLEVVETRDRHHGSLIGSQFGEPFYQTAPPRVVNTFDLFLP